MIKIPYMYKENHDLLVKVLRDEFEDAVRTFLGSVDFDRIPKNEIKRFLFCDGIYWPYEEIPKGFLGCYVVKYKGWFSIIWEADMIADYILEITNNYPREVLHALRNIQAARDWCLLKAKEYKKSEGSH